jgi:peptide subunit release factor 1 (eRF1)
VAHLLGASPVLAIVLVDRHRARIFDLRLGELTEREDLFHPLPRRGRSDGFAGYEGGHAQRRVEDEVRQHFKNIAENLKELMDQHVFQKWILACQDAHRPLFESQLHPYVRQALIGRFHADLAHATRDAIRSHAERILEKWQNDRCRELVSQALDHARSNGRGVTGLRRVLRSLELGEAQTLLIGENLQAQAIECIHCGHIDAHLVSYCPVCERATQEIVDVGEAILPWVISRDIETFYVKEDPEFDKVGNVAALLRFRSEKVQPISVTTAERLQKQGAEYPGRLRKYARR